MKKHFIIILAVLTLFVYGKTRAQNAYNFTEAKDSVAKIIWDKLKTEDECISSVINQLKKIDSKQLAKAEHYKSKTAMDFDFQTIDEYFVEDTVHVYYKLQCFPQKDGSWIGLIIRHIVDMELDINYNQCDDAIQIVQYQKGKKIARLKLQSVFPEDFSIAAEEDFTIPIINYKENVIDWYSYNFGPINLVWNGKKFETTSKLIYNCISNGDFSFFEYSAIFNQCNEIGYKWKGNSDNIFYDNRQNAIAKFDIKDGMIEGFALQNPKYGVAMEFTNDNYIAATPAAIGSQMQYVLNHLGEKPTTKEFKNGKFVVTQLINHVTKDLKRDVYIEFTSKDENSPIETIRVYSTPIKK